MKKTKKNIFTAAVAVALAAVMAIGGSIAYYQTSTATISNTFEKPAMTISLTEDGDQSYEIIPGTEEDKNPTVSVSTTIDSYVYLFVTDKTDGLVNYEINEDGWTILEDACTDTLTVYYREVEADTEAEWEVLVDNKVSYDTSLTLEDLDAAADDLSLSFYAFIVQADGFEDALEAFNAVITVGDSYIFYSEDEDGASITEEDGVITLSSDGTITLTEDIEGAIAVEDEAEVEIDTGNYDIESTTAGVAAVSVEYGSTVTLSGDGEVTNTANQTSNTAGSAAIFNNGTITVNGGTYSAESEDGVSWYTVINHGTMTINDGTFTNEAASTNSSLVENGYYDPDSGNSTTGYVEGVNQENPTLTINGGTFTSSASTCIKNDECGILVINGGEFTAKTYGWSVYNYADATFNGGTFNSYVYTKYVASNTMPATVEGATSIITGGTYNKLVSGNTGATIEISGGTFAVSPDSSYIVDGYSITTNDDGTYTVE